VSDDGAVEDVEGGEQRGCAVTFVVMRKPLKQSSLIPRRRENGSAPPSVTVFGFAIQKSYAIANARNLAFSYFALRTISQLLGWFSAVSALGAYWIVILPVGGSDNQRYWASDFEPMVQSPKQALPEFHEHRYVFFLQSFQLQQRMETRHGSSLQASLDQDPVLLTPSLEIRVPERLLRDMVHN
jgi:hypothetical protein